MNAHERCFAAISGKPVDRPPRYIPGIACDVASKILGRPVHTGTGSLRYAETRALMKGETAHQEFTGTLLEDLAELNRALDIDVYRIPWRQRRKPTKQIVETTFLFGNPHGNYLPRFGSKTVSELSPPAGEGAEGVPGNKYYHGPERGTEK